METELMTKMVDSIELQGKAINALISRIESVEKTIETYGKLIDRLETRLDRHEKSYAHGVE
jgi:hypothetical protein